MYHRNEPAGAGATGATSGGISVRPRVLVVEDDEATREMMVTLLGLAGCATDGCADPRQALGSLRRHPYDLVVTDYSLPYQTGGALLHQAEEEGLLGGTAPIVVTADPDPREAEGYEIVTKPFVVDDLLALVRARLGASLDQPR